MTEDSTPSYTGNKLQRGHSHSVQRIGKMGKSNKRGERGGGTQNEKVEAGTKKKKHTFQD